MGDCYDRFIIRIREMLESVYIVTQVVTNFLSLDQNFSYNNSALFSDYSPNRLDYMGKNTSMEALIEHFKHYSEGFKVNSGLTYQAVEAPKGEFGVCLISDGSVKPYRCKIRTPAFHHLQFMSLQMEGHYLADMITILGSQDIVFGEVDR